MAWKQTRGWDSNKGGTQAGMCLANVRKGYSIAAKYDDAWTAWLNTQQHRDRNYPAGVYSPIYFSYTTTIDGVRKNYGHIGVRYPDGRLWTDGRVYASVEEYERQKAPVFVGWGESVNGVRVIEHVKDPEIWVSLSKHVKEWRAYKIGSVPIKINAIAKLKPSKFGGLEFKVVEFRDFGKTAVIDTQDFGRVKIWLDKDASIFTK